MDDAMLDERLCAFFLSFLVTPQPQKASLIHSFIHSFIERDHYCNCLSCVTIMSSVYATEPATAGRVILETSDGPLEIFLWCRECPQTTRFFLQLCLDGYYNDMVFHRIVGNFLIQTGALRHESSPVPPDFSMSSPEAAAYREAVKATVALDRRSYEINSRIKFNHRGQVAMALGVEDSAKGAEDLQPQFFIILEDAPYLDSKHVIFGTISGPTIFNALRIGRTETDEATNTPVDLPNATRIQAVKIVENPIHQDLVPQPNLPWRQVIVNKEQDNNKQGTKKKKKKRKGKFDTNVLSFGAEFDEEDGINTTARKGIQSSHDVVDSKVLGKHVDEKLKQVLASEVETIKDDNRKELKRPKVEEDNAVSLPASEVDGEPTVTFSSRKERQRPASVDKEKPPDSDQHGTKATKDRETSAKPKVSLVETRRLKYSKGKKSKKEREEETLSKLISFRTTVQQKVEERKSSHNGGPNEDDEPLDNSLAARMARKAQKASGAEKQVKASDHMPTYHGQILDTSDHEDDNNDAGNKTSQWLATAFKCRKHFDHDSHLGGDGRDADDYKVIDPKRGGDKHKSRHRDETRHHHNKGRK
jgi:peptidyl-prolyl cis-trans isomerase SDCCAG10